MQDTLSVKSCETKIRIFLDWEPLPELDEYGSTIYEKKKVAEILPIDPKVLKAEKARDLDDSEKDDLHELTGGLGRRIEVIAREIAEENNRKIRVAKSIKPVGEYTITLKYLTR